jgi:hypothetical protein
VCSRPLLHIDNNGADVMQHRRQSRTIYPYYIQTAKQLGQYCHDFLRYESVSGKVDFSQNPSWLFEQDLWLYDTSASSLAVGNLSALMPEK